MKKGVKRCVKKGVKKCMNRRALSTATGWDDVPFDNQVMIWSMAGEAARAERYRARRLYFQFNGAIEQLTYLQLWRGGTDWLEMRLLNRRVWGRVRRGRHVQALERALETRLRAVVDEAFRPLPRALAGAHAARAEGGRAAADTGELDTGELDTDELNLTGDAWAQIGFRIQAVEPEFESDVEGEEECGEIRATSADGLHRIKVILFPWRADECRVQVQYVGPQRFRTEGDWTEADEADRTEADEADWTEADEADRTVAEYYRRGPRAGSSDDLDDPRVFEGWLDYWAFQEAEQEERAFAFRLARLEARENEAARRGFARDAEENEDEARWRWDAVRRALEAEDW
jgi:hypothetical protein